MQTYETFDFFVGNRFRHFSPITFYQKKNPHEIGSDDERIYSEGYVEIVPRDKTRIPFALIGLVGTSISTVTGLKKIQRSLGIVDNEFIKGFSDSIDSILRDELKLDDKISERIGEEDNKIGPLININANGKIIKLPQTSTSNERNEVIKEVDDKIIQDKMFFHPVSFIKEDSLGDQFEILIALRPQKEYKMILIGLISEKLRIKENRQKLFSDTIRDTNLTIDNKAKIPRVAIADALNREFVRFLY